MAEFKLPDVGEGLTEAEIVTWKVKVGDTVAINDIVVEIETAKSLVELPSPYAGMVQALMVPEGETVAVGTPIIAIGDARRRRRRARRADRVRPLPRDGREGRRRAAGAGDRPVQPGRDRRRRGRVASSAGYKADRGADPPRPQGRRRRRRRRRQRPAAGPGRVRARRRQSPTSVEADEPGRCPRTPPPAPRAGRPPGDVRVLAKPPVRKLAKDLGVDLAVADRHRPERRRHPRRRARRAAGGGAASSRRLAGAAVDAAPSRRARDARADQGRAQDDGPGDGRSRRSPPRTSPSGSPSTSPARWSSSSGSRRAASSATSRSRRCWCWPAP